MKARIYKIWSPHTQLCYIGQTTKLNVKQRLYEHISNYRRYYNQQKGNYRSSYFILDFPDTEIESLEEVEYETKKQLLEHERRWIDKTDSVNMVNRSNHRKIISL